MKPFDGEPATPGNGMMPAFHAPDASQVQALHKAGKTGETVTHENVAVETNGDVQPINLVVRPLPELGQDPSFFLVVFQELGPSRPRDAGAGQVPAGAEVASVPPDVVVRRWPVGCRTRTAASADRGCGTARAARDAGPR